MKTISSRIVGLLYCLVCIACLSACAEKEEPAPDPEKMITGKKWRLTAATTDPSFPTANGGTSSNLYNILKDCFKDNYEEFREGGVYIYDEGTTRCNTGDAQTEQGNWIMNTEKTKITISSAGGNANTYDDVEVTETSLKYTFVTTLDNSGTIYTVSVTAAPVP
ncbi:Lipocalin-like domain-containing protein [Catalinimonas alkaloidigena]|uniref:Lipocalin-like domain-containing protein n=1 Tax=Catalinimonas alkaloidigena TaxID=1075417 RepID=A0A1G9BGT6_9BACT|nr:lipocalin family protein [Catalinimonas alkaloidigena]SDK38647.1 Lipocalin-like domain-containing protein [Catalinimonas alkaloidigena]